MCIIASNARLAATRSGSLIAAVSARGVIRHDRPTSPCAGRGRFPDHHCRRSRSTSGPCRPGRWNENASLCLNAGPPFRPWQGIPSMVNSTVRTSPCLREGIGAWLKVSKAPFLHLALGKPESAQSGFEPIRSHPARACSAVSIQCGAALQTKTGSEWSTCFLAITSPPSRLMAGGNPPRARRTSLPAARRPKRPAKPNHPLQPGPAGPGGKSSRARRLPGTVANPSVATTGKARPRLKDGGHRSGHHRCRSRALGASGTGSAPAISGPAARAGNRVLFVRAVVF